MGELEVVRRQRERDSLHRQLERERPHIAKMRDIMQEQLYDEETIEKTMSSEWNLIASSGVLDDIIPDETERTLVKQFFTENYIELSDMYKFYFAVNSGGGMHTLEYIGFSKFLCETNIFRSSDGANSNVILKISLGSRTSLK